MKNQARLLIALNSFFFFVAYSATAAVSFCNDTLTAKTLLSGADLIKKVPLGTPAVLEHATLEAQVETLFLGKFIGQDGQAESYGFYDPRLKNVHFVSPEKTRVLAADQNIISPEQFKLFVQNESQVGGTCAAYSLYHCLRQVSLSDHAPALLKDSFSSESARIKSLMKAVNGVYIADGKSFRNTVIAMSKERDVSLFDLPNKSKVEFKASFIKHLKMGWPILFRFDIEPNMVDQDLTLLDHRGPNTEELRKRLWIPFKGGFLKSPRGGHAVIALGLVETYDRQYILISDPNWELPRLWPIEYLEQASAARMSGWVMWIK